jgi:DNA-binding response OmpR family regulator
VILEHDILIVEDDPECAETLRQFVTAAGHRARIATTVAEAKALLAAFDPCCSIVDRQLPAADGEPPLEIAGETCVRGIRMRYPGMSAAGFHEKPILVATGSGEGDKHRLVRSVFHMGGDSFIAKPFGANPKEVIDQIADALARGGRSDHRTCEDARRGGAAAAHEKAHAAEAPIGGEGVEHRVRLTAEKLGKRTIVLVDGERAALTDASFVLLVQLVVADSIERGAKTARKQLRIGAQAGNRLHEPLREVAPDIVVMASDRHGMVWLHPSIGVEPVDWQALAKHHDPVVRKLATERLARRRRG